jgi:CubicO group peptidase (beta-lactamase class C family)
MTHPNPTELGFLPDRLERIGAHIQSKYLDTGKLPFGALLVGRGDEVAHLWTSGVSEDAIFRIMSMTKPVTSIALMQLVEQGKIALSEPIAKYIPEFKDLGVFVAGGGNTPMISLTGFRSAPMLTRPTARRISTAGSSMTMMNLSPSSPKSRSNLIRGHAGIIRFQLI